MGQAIEESTHRQAVGIGQQIHLYGEGAEHVLLAKQSHLLGDLAELPCVAPFEGSEDAFDFRFRQDAEIDQDFAEPFAPLHDLEPCFWTTT
jgi:hypothetical protein